MARLERPPSFSSSPLNSSSPSLAPSPLARSGFVLVSQTYGALPSTLFATINPRLIHSFLFLSPLPPSLYFTSTRHTFLHSIPAFFTRTIPAITTELGLRRIASVLKGSSRKSRMLSGERDRIRGEMERAWLEEEGERDRGMDSVSSVAWERKKGRFPERHTSKGSFFSLCARCGP
jgi:hypothetical protein